MQNRIAKIILITISGLILLSAVFILTIDRFIDEYSADYVYTEIENVPDADTVLVLGASVYSSGRLSDILGDRAKNAIELFRNAKAVKILISGYKRDDNYDEVNSVKKFLLDNGIKEADILIDDQGYDTYDSIYRAKNNFEIKKMIISTQGYHLPRAIYIARNLGIDAYGLASDLQTYQKINYFMLREKFAKVKAFIEVLAQ